MRILFLSDRLPHSQVAGGHRLIYRRIHYLAEHGHEVGLASFARNANKNQIRDLKSNLFDLEMVASPKKNILLRILDYAFGRLPPIFSRSYSSEMMKVVGDMMESSHYDIIVAEFDIMGQYLYRNPHLSAVNTVLSCHHGVTSDLQTQMHTAGVPLLTRLKSLFQIKKVRRYERKMYNCADRVLVLTPHEQATLLDMSPNLDISVVPMGVDVTYLQKQKENSQDPQILMTGDFSDPANRDAIYWFITRIWPAIKKNNPESVFSIVGPNLSGKIRRMAEKESRIEVIGWVDDLRPYRAGAMVFVCPVRLGSGMRTKCLESMASELPVVSTSLGMEGIRAENGNNCLIADTPELFAQGVNLLLTDEDLRRDIRKQGRQTVEKEFSHQKSMHYFEKVLRDIVAN